VTDALPFILGDEGDPGVDPVTQSLDEPCLVLAAEGQPIDWPDGVEVGWPLGKDDARYGRVDRGR
jgi:hypothetical protein